jgi:hypothetical protein
VIADVLAYRIPDEVSVVYMFNPFRGATLESVIAQLIASVDRRPRAVRVILRNGDQSRSAHAYRAVQAHADLTRAATGSRVERGDGRPALRARASRFPTRRSDLIGYGAWVVRERCLTASAAVTANVGWWILIGSGDAGATPAIDLTCG